MFSRLSRITDTASVRRESIARSSSIVDYSYIYDRRGGESACGGVEGESKGRVEGEGGGEGGDSSVVEPAPPDTQVLRCCGFESH